MTSPDGTTDVIESKRHASGSKYTNARGVAAIKDGIKQIPVKNVEPPARRPKPPWLRIRLETSPAFNRVRSIVREHSLATVCEESHCPNQGECWSAGTATFMLMGDVCTRACRFCAVDTGNPKGWLDKNEPHQVAESTALMGLRYVVLTSVDRDDLDDGGAAHYAACVRAIRQRCPDTVVEALTPDFRGDNAAIEKVADSGIAVFAQNLETVERLTHPVRDPRAGYGLTLSVLRRARREGVMTKSSLMLGLGETDDELRRAFDDLRAANVDLLTLGQYLQPTRNHLAVERWVHPDEFARYREEALSVGFAEVAAGPLVRSSYRADELARRTADPA